MAADLMPKTDEHAAVRKQFHKWCRNQGIKPELWMPSQPWIGYEHSRVQDYWTGWLACSNAGVTQQSHQKGDA
jgi:hypothetical protein